MSARSPQHPDRSRRHVCALRRVGGAAIVVLALLAIGAGPATARAKGRCCFQLSVQGLGYDYTDYGNGDQHGRFPHYRGSYNVSVKFAARMLVKVDGAGELDSLAPFRFRAKGHPKVALHDYTVDWLFDDDP